MRDAIIDALGRARSQVVDDLQADPYLAYVLLLAFLLASFWIWHRLPNFATRDERWRIVDPIEPLGFLVDDPRPASVREGVEFWRSYGAVFYLYGLVLLPVVIVVFATGQADVFADIAHHRPRGYWHYWNRVPAWVWTAAVLAGRLVNVLLSVGSVYVLYRIGTRLRDRRTGRLAALLLSLTWGFLVLAHEAGEDVPALFLLLLVVYFAIGFLQTGAVDEYYAGCVCGGLAIAFKLTAGTSVILLGTAFLLRWHRVDASDAVALDRRRLLVIGATLGALAILLGYPSVLVGAPEEFAADVWLAVVNKSTPHYWLVAPSWWWILRGYLHGFGLPLFVGVLVGLAASLARVGSRSDPDGGVLLLLVGIATYLVAFAPWAFVRMHHLLPTFPLFLLVLSIGVIRLSARRPRVARLAMVGLVVTSGAYAGVGVAGYASQPRDEAAAWLSTHASENATVETYINDPQDAAVPHGMSVYHSADREMVIDGTARTPGVIEWTLAMPERCPDYIQLNYQGGIRYLRPANDSDRTRLRSYPRLRRYFRDLLAEETYPYAVAAEFGPRPRFLDSKAARSPGEELLHVGIVPRSIQYGDPQDFGVNQYTVILERTGPCEPERRSPFSVTETDHPAVRDQRTRSIAPPTTPRSRV